MAPWGADSEVSPVTAEKAMSFISKSWLDVRKSADEDIKRMRARAKSFTELANSFDKELENFKKASLNLGSYNKTSESFFRTFKDSGGLYTALNKSHLEELDFLRKPLSQFRRSHSNPDLANQENQLVERRRGAESKPDVSLWKQALIPCFNEEDFYLKGVEATKTQPC